MAYKRQNNSKVIVARFDAVDEVRLVAVHIVVLLVLFLQRSIVLIRVVRFQERLNKVQLLRFAIVEEALLPYGLLAHFWGGSRLGRRRRRRWRRRRGLRPWNGDAQR